VDETGGFKEVQPVAESLKEAPSSLAEKLNAQNILKTIHFEFDKYDLKAGGDSDPGRQRRAHQGVQTIQRAHRRPLR